MDNRCGLLNRPTESGGDDAWRIEERRAETLPFPFVPAIWHVGRLYAGRYERRRRMRFKLRSIDMLEARERGGENEHP